MKSSRILPILLAMLSITISAQVSIEPGVSLQLAQFRKAHVSNVEYDLSFNVPEQMSQPVTGNVIISFDWNGNEDLQIDFQGDQSQFTGNGTIAGKETQLQFSNEHIIVPKRLLAQGRNKIGIKFTSGNNALNRHEEYLYTLFVPDHARSVFPCFDQPDLKASYRLTVNAPQTWKVISNTDCIAQQSGKHEFAPTKLLPTYLFSFTAGLFNEAKANRDGRELTVLYRETDPDKVAQLPIVFDEIALSIRWMEQYTGIKYPFEKYGCIVIPGYQFGGMEHPGCIQYADWEIFTGKNPTPDDEMVRLHLIAHETSHMWFGDLVTMQWFNDVWTKEVFANFLADKIAREQFPDINHELSFIKTHYPRALEVDRTSGTHPIQQPLNNLNQAGLLYGNIIYHKAPIMMKKLEERMGEAALQRGLQAYLHKYAYSNTTWDGLIQILDSVAPDVNILDFDSKWVKHQGVNQIEWDIANGIPNPDGTEYAQFLLKDEAAFSQYMAMIEGSNEQTKLSALMTTYENAIMHRISDTEAITFILLMASEETNKQLLTVANSYLGSLLAQVNDEETRRMAEETYWVLVENHNVNSFRKELALTVATQASASPEVINQVYNLWKSQSDTLLSERDYMHIAYHLAIVCPSKWQEILAEQRSRLTNQDRVTEFDFISRACTPDTNEQQRLFNSLLIKENRAVEPYARQMLALLNDPTREPFSNRYILPGLNALEEIQLTGDIFFPGHWCNSLLSGHRSTEAKHLVEQFLNEHSDYNKTLKNKLLQSAFFILNN